MVIDTFSKTSIDLDGTRPARSTQVMPRIVSKFKPRLVVRGVVILGR